MKRGQEEEGMDEVTARDREEGRKRTREDAARDHISEERKGKEGREERGRDEEKDGREGMSRHRMKQNTEWNGCELNDESMNGWMRK